MKSEFTIMETYWKTIEVCAKTEEKAQKLAKEQAQKMSLSQERAGGADIGFVRDVIPQNESLWWERLLLIAEETEVNWYQDLLPYQRQDLTKEELFRYAEEMRKALERIFDIAYEYERNGYK